MSRNKYDLSIEQMEEIIDKGIEYGVLDPLPMATEIIDFAIDAWGEGIDEDDEDETVRTAGRQIKHLLKVAKIVPDA